MNETEQNFEELKRLLAFKRHEVPPPGYFSHFSGQVISRIRAGEAGGPQNFVERLQKSAPWLADFLRIFEARPGLIGGMATSLCLLLVLSVIFADRPDAVPQNLLSVSEASAAAVGAVAAMAETPPLAAASDSSGIVASTNPVTSLQPTATLFGQAGASPLFQPAGFLPAGQ